VALITEKGNSIAQASRNLDIKYSVQYRWKLALALVMGCKSLPISIDLCWQLD
jgi:hypothetical protein